MPNRELWIPKIGAVKIHLYRPIPLGASLKEVHVKKRGEKWFVSIVLELGAAPAKRSIASVIGLDVGLSSFAALSTGAFVENPRFYRAGEDALARRQQSLSRKRRGSSSRARAKELVRRAHERIRNQRRDFVRKLAATLFSRYDLVAFENLNVKGMAAGPLSKSVTDAGWSLFRHCLESKAEEAGKWAVAVDPRGTSIECSRCGEAVPKTLKERTHACSRCGLILDRDVNAARNILARGLRALEAA
jgi:putative transposase